MTNAELLGKIKSEIERLKGVGGIVPLDNREQKTGYESALIDIEIFLDTLEEELVKDFPTTDEEMARFLASHPKVDVPDKYKTPDWIFEESEKPKREEARLKGWIARDEDGDLHFFISKPNRYNRRGVFEVNPGVWSLNEFTEARTFPLSKEKFPDVKWADKPRQAELTIRYAE